MLQLNTPAPNFTLPNQSGESICLDDYMDISKVVLYFYPRDDTSGCTLEAQQFSALIEKFSANQTVIIGVSKDSCKSHKSFITKYDLKVELIADVDGELCNKYGAWQEKEKNGVKKMGIVRSTFIIDKNGKLIYQEYGVKADGHAQSILEKVKAL